MRVFGLLGLVLALLIVGLLVKKQVGGSAAPQLPGSAGTPAASVRDQSQQIQQQFKQSLDAALLAPRKMPDV
jgi:hypothetical protein